MLAIGIHHIVDVSLPDITDITTQQTAALCKERLHGVLSAFIFALDDESEIKRGMQCEGTCTRTSMCVRSEPGTVFTQSFDCILVVCWLLQRHLVTTLHKGFFEAYRKLP